MKKQIFMFLIAVLLLSSCSAQAPALDNNTMNESVMSSSDGRDTSYAPAAENAETTSLDQAAIGSGEDSTMDRMIIHNAYIEITVTDPQDSTTKIQRMVDEFSGFLIQSNITRVSQYLDGYGYYYLSKADINFRVPASRLNDALDFVRSQVNDPDLDVTNESISGQDVTKEYTDLDAQLISLEAAKETMVSFLDSAQKIDDVLTIYREIQQLDSEIERIKGEMKYYEESSAFSSIHVIITQSEEELNQIQKDLQDKFIQNEKETGSFDVMNWQPILIAKDALEMLVNVLMGIGSILIWILLFIAPVFLVIAAPIYFLVKFLTRKKKKTDQSKEQTS